MAKQNQSDSSIGLDRRQLLASVAVISTAGLAPIAECAEPPHLAEAATEATIPASDVPALKVCAGTAEKIEKIAARNIIRAEAGLPLLSIPKELRRMKTVEDATVFEEFAERHRQAVWEEVLGLVREAKGEPYWCPTGFMEGVAFQSRVSRILRKRFEMAQHSPGEGLTGWHAVFRLD